MLTHELSRWPVLLSSPLNRPVMSKGPVGFYHAGPTFRDAVVWVSAEPLFQTLQPVRCICSRCWFPVQNFIKKKKNGGVGAGSCHWLYDGTGQFDRLVCWSAPGSLVLVSVTFSAAQYRQSSNWCTQHTPEQMIDWSMWITCHQAWSICFNEHPMPEQAQT